MTIDLYQFAGSAACSSIRLLARTLGVDLNLKPISLMAGEHLTPEFLKINPQHTIPTIVDNGFSLWESRAILVYLVEKYAADSPLYPKCPRVRAVVHQRLHFELGTLYARFGDYYFPQFMGGKTNPEKLTKLHEALDFLNKFLEGKTYIAGNEFTIADYSMFALMTTIETAKIDIEKHENVAKWYAVAKKVIGPSDIVDEHIAAFKGFMEKAGL